MCGRFASTTPPDQLASYFGAETSVGADEVEPDYNVAPTRGVPVVRVRAEERHLDYLRWGLVPRWAKDIRIGSKLINARAETAASKPAFRSAFAKRRCLVVADGFYEWKRLDAPKGEKQKKQPMYITATDGAPLAFAGLFERWIDAEAERELHSCTILTTTPNETMAPIHDRMPVILDRADWQRWLDPSITNVEELQSLLVPASNAVLGAIAVSTQVNSVKNNDASLIKQVQP